MHIYIYNEKVRERAREREKKKQKDITRERGQERESARHRATEKETERELESERHLCSDDQLVQITFIAEMLNALLPHQLRLFQSWSVLCIKTDTENALSAVGGAPPLARPSEMSWLKCPGPDFEFRVETFGFRVETFGFRVETLLLWFGICDFAGLTSVAKPREKLEKLSSCAASHQNACPESGLASRVSGYGFRVSRFGFRHCGGWFRVRVGPG